MGARPLSQTTRDRASAQRPAGPGRLILAVNSSAVGLNVVAGDQYVADVLPSRMFSSEFERRGLAPEALSRAVEDSGTVTSVLVPWNTCGAYISGVLGVPTASYFPYCFFNFLSPILDVLYGFIGFKVPSITPETQIPESERGQETIATTDP
jgi:NhaC family Na+:H+ antiporter